MKPHDLQRLVSACINSMRQEDAGASLTVAPSARLRRRNSRRSGRGG